MVDEAADDAHVGFHGAIVLAISGNDPSGGAGIQADIEACAAMGAFCAPTITALTVQDTRNAWRVDATAPELVVAQAEAVLADLHVRVVKLGLLATVEVAHAVADLLDRHPALPVVLDPVLIAGGGARLAEADITKVMRERLVPRAALVTPNLDEVEALAPGADSPDDAARAVLGQGAEWILLKGAHEATPLVRNRLFGRDRTAVATEWPRLPGSFHGSGCTLASAIAALMAGGATVPDAVADAQVWIQDALAQAHRIGHGQAVPNRMHRPRGGA